MSEVKNIKKRNEIPDQYKWAIEDLYSSNEAWEKEFNQVKNLSEQLLQYQGQLGLSSKHLYDYLVLHDQVSRLLERVYVYANQKYHEDTTNGLYQDLSDKSTGLMVQVSSAKSFATTEILEIPEGKLDQFYEELPELTEYRTWIDQILRRKPHILSSAEEKLLALSGDMAENPDNIFSMFNNADLKFGSIHDEDGNLVEISHSRYSTFLQSKDRRVRREAFQTLYAAYRKFQNTLAATYSGNIKKEVFFAKARKYPSTLAMELDDSNIPTEVYTNLIEAVHEHLPAMYQYVSLRKKALGLDEIHMYDLYVPMVENVDMKVPFEEAKSIVKEALAPMGANYQAILEEGYNHSWIDVYENEGKRSGAYSWGAYGTHPYVLLNYQDNLNNVFTLAHEMGHAIHSYLSDHTQPYIYAGYKIFVAEVASTCNESLLMHYLLKQTDDKQKKAYLINYHLEQFRTTLYRQTMFAEFEMITHKEIEDGKPLTANRLCEIYHELNHLYFGDEIVIDDEIDMEWSRIPHFYNSFYVYQYATGYSAAIALSRQIIQEGDVAVNRYLDFLRGGSSKSPIELLRGAGVDMSTATPIHQALNVFEELLAELEELLND